MAEEKEFPLGRVWEKLLMISRARTVALALSSRFKVRAGSPALARSAFTRAVTCSARSRESEAGGVVVLVVVVVGLEEVGLEVVGRVGRVGREEEDGLVTAGCLVVDGAAVVWEVAAVVFSSTVGEGEEGAPAYSRRWVTVAAVSVLAEEDAFVSASEKAFSSTAASTAEEDSVVTADSCERDSEAAVPAPLASEEAISVAGPPQAVSSSVREAARQTA